MERKERKKKQMKKKNKTNKQTNKTKQKTLTIICIIKQVSFQQQSLESLVVITVLDDEEDSPFHNIGGTEKSSFI